MLQHESQIEFSFQFTLSSIDDDRFNALSDSLVHICPEGTMAHVNQINRVQLHHEIDDDDVRKSPAKQFTK